MRVCVDLCVCVCARVCVCVCGFVCMRARVCGFVCTSMPVSMCERVLASVLGRQLRLKNHMLCEIITVWVVNK